MSKWPSRNEPALLFRPRLREPKRGPALLADAAVSEQKFVKEMEGNDSCSKYMPLFQREASSRPYGDRSRVVASPKAWMSVNAARVLSHIVTGRIRPEAEGFQRGF